MTTNNTLQGHIRQLGQQAQTASRKMATFDSTAKNKIIESMAAALDAQRSAVKQANTIDLQQGERSGLSNALLDRLALNDERIDAIIEGMRQVIALEDPVGTVLENRPHENGMTISKIRVPIGVIGIVYESRPNVTADAAILCLKAGNAVILRGGKEAAHSNGAISSALLRGGEQAGLPQHAIQLIETTDREAVKHLVQLTGLLDVIIPRGGESLITAVTEMAHVPVIKHYKGVCHVYVDATADIAMSLDIAENAKCQRPGVCNAMETLLVHQDIADEFLPRLAERLKKYGVELRGDEGARTVVPVMKPAKPEDWEAEYLDLILAVKVVSSTSEAIDHINTFGSHHSDAIVTRSEDMSKRFAAEVDSAAVYINTSTRFTDGSAFGLGAEIGISTDKLHARGPMGLAELTTYKWLVSGNGQIR